MHTAWDEQGHTKNVYYKVKRLNFEVNKIISFFSISHPSKILESKQISCLHDVYNQRCEMSYTNFVELHFQGQPSRSGGGF